MRASILVSIVSVLALAMPTVGLPVNINGNVKRGVDFPYARQLGDWARKHGLYPTWWQDSPEQHPGPASPLPPNSVSPSPQHTYPPPIYATPPGPTYVKPGPESTIEVVPGPGDKSDKDNNDEFDDLF